MSATQFDLDAPLGQHRAIIRRDSDGVEMGGGLGLRPGQHADRPYTLVRALADRLKPPLPRASV
ncbi:MULTISPECIES: hypothetical protein [unclassified Acidisoma]|jgi:hypothetical protein|uniref:hypothetical protein n=1 Tax=unclassified Acidisoma TaxID=2634065 RepID=UPI00131BBE59|nr:MULTISPECIES: hypothetical protein [unclassified Acidisoma]